MEGKNKEMLYDIIILNSYDITSCNRVSNEE